MSSSDSEPPSPDQSDTSEFFFDGRGASALLIHGLTGTPYEMRFLGERLALRGVRVLGVKLAGHAGTPQELENSNHNSWYESVVNGLERLRAFGDPVVVVGQSAGALLAARLAIDQLDAVSGVVMLAPAFFLPRWTGRALAALRLVGPWVSRLYIRGGGPDIHDAHARLIHPRSELMPLGAALSLVELSQMVRRRIDRLSQPTLIIHSRKDHTCPFERNINFLTHHMGGDQVRVVTLERSYHVISVDTEKEQVAAETAAFIDGVRAMAASTMMRHAQ